MSKPHRGKSIRDLPFHGRGTCPVCNKSGVKILYEQDSGGEKIKICKICRATIRNGKKALPANEAVQATAAAAPAPAAAPVAAAAPVEATETVEAAEDSGSAEVTEAAEDSEPAEAVESTEA